MKQKLSPRRRALSLLLALSLIFGLLPGSAFAAEATEPEAVSNGHWASSYLNQLVEWGFIRADQAQDPDRLLTRADFMSIVNRAYGYHEPGATPFEDVTEYDWFYDDVNIAYNAGYIKGVSDTEAGPNMTLDRQTATTILARNMMLQESPGEMTEFSDVREIDNWARGVIKSSMEHYLVTGYDDGTFRPKKAMTWGEIAAMVSRTIGTPLQDAGDYSLGGVFGNVTITSPGVTLRDTVVSGDLYITGGVGLGGVKLENVTVLGRIIASGTGSSEGGASILLRNVMADELLIDNLRDNEVSVQADGITEIGKTTVRTSAYIEDNTPEGMGLHLISLEGDYYGEDEEPPEGWEPAKLTLAGRIEEVINRTPDTTVHVAKGTVAKLTVDETAQGSHVIIDRGAVVKNLILDAGIDVTGDGDITHLEVNAPGANVEMLPDEIVIRPGITAVIAGHEMDSASAEEFLLDPMILAGYPRAQDIAPTSLEAVFAGNKQGRIYWAVSAVTDGSIGAEDLLKPPSYGNKAVRWGTADLPRGNEEVISKITGLTSNGEYYLSAVLEDAKGQLSPVKVISFTTPDNTIPAFNKGYPYMSKKSALDSVVVASVTKDCKLYYALLPENATAPTEADFRANAVAGALGFGIVDMQKNIEAAFRVNDQVLQEKTKYILYLWLVDADGVNKSAVVSLPFTTDDDTPPEFVMGPEVSSVQATSVSLTFRLSEDGTVYWVAVPAGTIYPKPEPGTDYDTAPLDSMYAKLQVASGMNLGTGGKSGRVTARELVDGTINVTGLEKEKAYDFYYVAKDNAGTDKNYSYYVGKMTIYTLDTNGPKVTQSFSKNNGTDKKPEPQSDTEIYLDISENVRYSGEGGGRGFKELYEDIATGGDSARAKLASNLYGAIKLYRIVDNELVPVGYNIKPYDIKDKAERDKNFTDAMTIDYAQATITTRAGGAIRITFPASGLHLANGSRYVFLISNLTDTSNNQNPLAPDNPDFVINFYDESLQQTAISLGHNVPVFEVAPARVWFTDNKVPKDAPKDRTDAPNTEDGKVVPIDFFFRLRPEGTGTTAEEVCYDILLWFNATVTYDLYYRIVDKDDFKKLDPADYTGNLLPSKDNGNPDYNGWIKLGTQSVSPRSGFSGRAVNKDFNGCDATNFPSLNTLDEDLRYEFVVSLTAYDGKELDQRNLWSGNITLHANVAAGEAGPLNLLTDQLSTSEWAKRQKDNSVRSIGRWINRVSDTVDTYEGEWGQVDRGMPRFNTPSPSITTTSDSATVTVNLSSNGLLHYAVTSISPISNQPAATATRKLTEEEIEAAKKIKSENEGKPELEKIKIPWSNESANEIYVSIDSIPGIAEVPWNGAATMPDWMVGTPLLDGRDDPQGKNLVLSPTSMNIARINTWTTQTGRLTDYDTVDCSGGHNEEIKIDGLIPETDYFIYLVLENGSEEFSHVYIYHFRTLKASKPKIEPLDYYYVDDKTGGAKIGTDIDSRLYYLVIPYAAAIDKNILGILSQPVQLTDEYLNSSIGIDKSKVSADGTITALDALSTLYYGTEDPAYNRDYEGYTLFDIYASPDQKNRMTSFLRGQSLGDEVNGSPTDVIVDRSNSEMRLVGGTAVNQLLKLYPGTRYVIIAVARVPNPSTTVASEVDSYRAYLDLRLGSATPPEVDTSNGTPTWYAQVGQGAKRSDPYYDGMVTIPFDQIVYCEPGGSSASRLTVEYLLGGAGPEDINPAKAMVSRSTNGIFERIGIYISHDGGKTSITFRPRTGEEGWHINDHITIPGGLLYAEAPGISNFSKTLNIDVTLKPDGTGLLVTLSWTGLADGLFPSDFASTEFYIDLYLGTEKLPDPPTVTVEKDKTKDVRAVLSRSIPNATYTWTISEGKGIIEITEGGSPDRITIKGIESGSATITLNVYDNESGRTETKQLKVDIPAELRLETPADGGRALKITGENAVTWTLQQNSYGTLAVYCGKNQNVTENDVELIYGKASYGKNQFTVDVNSVDYSNATGIATIKMTMKDANGHGSTNPGPCDLTVKIGSKKLDLKVRFEGSQVQITNGTAIGSASDNPAYS